MLSWVRQMRIDARSLFPPSVSARRTFPFYSINQTGKSKINISQLASTIYRSLFFRLAKIWDSNLLIFIINRLQLNLYPAIPAWSSHQSSVVVFTPLINKCQTESLFSNVDIMHRKLFRLNKRHGYVKSQLLFNRRTCVTSCFALYFSL